MTIFVMECLLFHRLPKVYLPPCRHIIRLWSSPFPRQELPPRRSTYKTDLHTTQYQSLTSSKQCIDLVGLHECHNSSKKLTTGFDELKYKAYRIFSRPPRSHSRNSVNPPNSVDMGTNPAKVSCPPICILQWPWMKMKRDENP